MVNARVQEHGKVELAAIVVFGIGCLLAVLTLPAVAWMQLLPISSGWMRTALLTSAIVPVGLGLAFAAVRGIQYGRAAKRQVRSDRGQAQGE